MATVARLLVTVALVFAAAAAADAQSLKPQWSRPVGGATRLVGVEEYGRCSVFVDKGSVQVMTPTGEVSWAWPFSKISKYINPGEVAVSHTCDAIAFVGNASYKYVWIVDREGRSASIKFVATPADVEFDRSGKYVAVGTYAGSMFLYSINGELQWQREIDAPGVLNLEFTDDNQHILFKGWLGVGVVSLAGQVEWTQLATYLAASKDLRTLILGFEPNHGPGPSFYTVADEHRREFWSYEGSPTALVSSTGNRVLGRRGGIKLSSRDGAEIWEYEDYRGEFALSEDGTRAWLRGWESVDCVDDAGNLLATIVASPGYRGVSVSRDFGQVLIVTEKDLHPISVERYEVPRPCRSERAQ